MTNEQIDAELDKVQKQIDALGERRARLNLIRSGYITTDAEKDAQLVKADEATSLAESIAATPVEVSGGAVEAVVKP